MAARKQFLLRVDPALWRELERWASDELRSVNAQVEWLLREAVRRRRGGGSAAPRPVGRDPAQAGARSPDAAPHTEATPHAEATPHSEPDAVPPANLPRSEGGAGAAPPGGAAPAPPDTTPD